MSVATMHPLEFYPHRTFDKLRYSDDDRQSHINNAVYTTFLETGRVEILFDDENPLKPEGTSFVIARLELDYLAEANWPGRVDIGTRIVAFGKSSFHIEQTVYQQARPVAAAKTVIVLMDNATRRSTPLPASMIERLSAYLKPDA